MKQAWARYLAWFASLKEREQKIVALAVLAGGLFLGYTYGIEPAWLEAKRQQKAGAEAKAATAQLVQQSELLKQSNRDPDAPLRVKRDQLRGELSKQGERFQAVEKSLVPASRMSALLETMVSRAPGLQLAELRTLPPEPVLVAKPTTDAAAAEPKEGGNAATVRPNLYRHGVEIRLVGAYQDLTAYVAALEAAPQRLLWGRMELATREWPRSQLTLTVYTLSLDQSWLTL